MHRNSCALSLNISPQHALLTAFSAIYSPHASKPPVPLEPFGRPGFSLVPLPALAFPCHSELASVRANEVLDDLTIPGYGQSTSRSIQLGVVMLNSRKHPTAERNPVVQHQFPAPGQFERLLDSDEAAALLGIHKKTLQRMARTGELPGFQIGDLWRFRASTLNEWLASKLAS